MMTFHLIRKEDESGVSGTGVVAEGVEFTDGACALRWMTKYKTLTIYECLGDLEAIHGHDGKTEVVWRN